MRNKVYLVIALIALSTSTFAQTADSVRLNELQKQNIYLQEQLTKLEQRTHELTIQVASNSEKVAQLNNTTEQKVGKLHEQIVAVDDHYGLLMDSTGAALRNTDTRQHKSVVWGIVIAVAICLLLFATFLILRKRISKKGDDIELLRARADDLNRQMVERMDKEIGELQKISEGLNNPQTTQTTSEPDHSLVKALADRITFMEMTLYRMDSSIKGHRHLTKSIKQMKDNLLANGYELVDMLGKDYVEGMKVTASFVVDDTLEDGKQIITGIQKPQINYKGKMIQAAQITVSQNI